MADPDRCPYCQSVKLATTFCEPPSHHYARTDCVDCGRFLRWEPTPMTDERAANFMLPFGEHRDRSLEAIGSSAKGLSYLRWLLTNPWMSQHRGVARAVEHYLAHVAPGREARS